MPRRRMKSPPDWDEKIAKFYGVELQSVATTKDGVRFKFKEGGQCTLVNSKIGDELRSFEDFEVQMNGKLNKVEIIKCQQESPSGSLPVKSSCTFSISAGGLDSFTFSAFNEHNGLGGEASNFQFDLK